MKISFRQLAVIATTILTLGVNGLANALPINGLATAQISDQFKVYFVPAGYVFSIWGVIYIGLMAFAIFQALPSQQDNPRLRAIGWWMTLGNIANALWIFLWHYLQIPLTLIAMLVLLAALLVSYIRINNGEPMSSAEKWLARLPVSIYLGWITVATVANITDVLYYVNWNGFGIAPEMWMNIILAAVLLIAAAMNFIRRDVAYTLVILWALAGIAVKHAASQGVATAVWVTFALVAASLLAAFALGKPNQKARLV